MKTALAMGSSQPAWSSCNFSSITLAAWARCQLLLLYSSQQFLGNMSSYMHLDKAPSAPASVTVPGFSVPIEFIKLWWINFRVWPCSDRRQRQKSHWVKSRKQGSVALIDLFQKIQIEFSWVWWMAAVWGMQRHLAFTDSLQTIWYFSKQCPEGRSGVCELLSCKELNVFTETLPCKEKDSRFCLPCTASGYGKVQTAAVHSNQYLQ